MKEIKVETYLVEQVELHGGTAEKFSSPGRIGVPDRICSWDLGCIEFVECKRPKGGRLSKAQERDHERRRKLGARVFTLWTREEVDAYIKSRKAYWIK
jgi:hypothetical protein